MEREGEGGGGGYPSPVLECKVVIMLCQQSCHSLNASLKDLY